MKLLEIKNINKTFKSESNFLEPKKITVALKDINLEVYEGETLGLVGESGCGKSTLGNVITRQLKEDSGKIFFQDKDITDLKGEELRKFRKNIQMIFQDSKSILNPHYKIGWILQEPLKAHGIDDENKRLARIKEVIGSVKLSEDYLDRRANQLSGGEAQRIGIAIALLLNPKLIIADEPVSSLDVSIQAEILNNFVDVKKNFKTTMIFITHNLSVCNYISDRIVVMYFGNIVEIGSADDVYNNPQHPYTKLLLSSSLQLDRKMKKEDREKFGIFKLKVECGGIIPEFKKVGAGHYARI